MADEMKLQPEQAAREVGRGRPQAAARKVLALIAIACAIVFLLDSYEVATHPLLFFDRPVERLVQAVPWGPLGLVMTVTNTIAGTWQVIASLLAITMLWLLERRAGMLMALGSLGSLLDQVIKDMFARHRPDASLVHVLSPVNGYSYPSGHAVFYTWLCFMLAAGLAPRVNPRWRPPLWAGATFIVLMACLGRIWVGAHWPSDVIGGFVLGLGWSAFVLWIPERWLPSPSRSWFRPLRRLRVPG